MSFELPMRPGTRPTTTDCAPHEQVSQNSPPEIHAEFKRRAFELPFVERRPSGISVPGAEALVGFSRVNRLARRAAGRLCIR